VEPGGSVVSVEVVDGTFVFAVEPTGSLVSFDVVDGTLI
jgi:hypothetical protein